MTLTKDGLTRKEYRAKWYRENKERIQKKSVYYNHYSWGDGDSLDRERVRDIILEKPQFTFGGV